ncbi:hypothetical protein SE17_27290 [Kouleothrix aurantiaca]|uniref:Uncharacterized protein n=1 Tax=Kouleothrix aurantiaca TaxID=186479 RepID=A0A0P9DKJ5_9CHLR|nr:hypothetical protein SE17_27290 [Kouleothrix aurantiaca]
MRAPLWDAPPLASLVAARQPRHYLRRHIYQRRRRQLRAPPVHVNTASLGTPLPRFKTTPTAMSIRRAGQQGWASVGRRLGSMSPAAAAPATTPRASACTAPSGATPRNGASATAAAKRHTPFFARTCAAAPQPATLTPPPACR